MAPVNTMIALAAGVTTAAAFTVPTTTRTPALTLSRSTTESNEAMDLDLEEMFDIFEEADKEVETEPDRVRMSEALPWMPRPATLDGYKLAGDRGFDPLGLGKTKADLIKYRNAEIKHARLAMLAAAGWPLSELYDGGLAKAFNMPTELTSDGLAPSILNGGLGMVSPVYWAAVVALAAGVELAPTKPESNLPGDYGFDPLGLYPADPKERAQFQESELRHGRTAMVAIVAFAVQEAIAKVPVTKETPFFFEPFWQFAHDMGFGDLSRGFYEIPTM